MTRAYKFLAEYLKPYRMQIIVICISVAIVSFAVLGLGYALKYLIDQGFTAHNQQSLNYAFMLLIAMVLLLSFASYNRSSRINFLCEQIEASIKKDAFSNLIKISPSYFELNKTSDVISRLSSDLSLISSSITVIASTALRNLMMTFGGVAMLLFTSFKLTSYVLIALPIIILPIMIVGRKIRLLSKENQQNIANSNAHMEESFSFIKIVQSYNNQEFECNRFIKALDNNLKLAQKRIKFRSLFFATAIGVILSSITFVLWIGGHDVLVGKMTAGSLSSFIFYAILVASSLGSLSETYGDIERSLGGLERIIEIILAKSPIIELKNPIKLIETETPNLELKNLCFSYPSRPEILKNINVLLQNSTAIVGASGAGKTTIFQLLLRFYDPTDGEVRLNGVDIKKLSLNQLRSQFALVSQDPVIFSASAYDNILYGNLNANKQQVIEAAKAAEIYEFFSSLPNGLDTFLGEKGVKLSGGQRQRIAIARAILRDPKILLLDEATSSLDHENEKLVQLALSRLREKRMTLVIAHRLSTVINSDNIIILDQGQIVGQGKHKELLASNELYKSWHL